MVSMRERQQIREEGREERVFTVGRTGKDDGQRRRRAADDEWVVDVEALDREANGAMEWRAVELAALAAMEA